MSITHFIMVHVERIVNGHGVGAFQIDAFVVIRVIIVCSTRRHQRLVVGWRVVVHAPIVIERNRSAYKHKIQTQLYNI